MVTINEIAKLAGVSKATVLKDLNDKGDISIKTKRKIKKIAKEIGYILNSIAKSFVKKKTYTIGLILSYLRNLTTIERIKGIQDTLFNSRFVLITCFSEKENCESYIKEMISRKVDGIILTPIMNSLKEVNILIDRKIPFVLMSENIEEGDFDFVGDNDFYGGEIATEHLIRIGHRRIAYFGIYSDNQIRKGYIEKLNEYGIDDISIIGYDNIDFLSIFHIPLTTVSQLNYEIGKHVAILITEKIKNPDTKPKNNIQARTYN